MNITVFGSGYVGLVQATVLADVGHQVICVDVDEQKVAALMDGQVPIYEPGLESLLQRNIKSGSWCSPRMPCWPSNTAMCSFWR